MADVQFNETELSAARPAPSAGKVSGMTKLLIAMGLAKDAKSAERVWLIVAVAALVLTGIIVVTNFLPSAAVTEEVLVP